MYFPTGHPKEGHPTNFSEKIENGERIHILRNNFKKWKKVEKAFNTGEALLMVCCRGIVDGKFKFYNPKRCTSIHVQQLYQRNPKKWWIDDEVEFTDFELFAKNEGMTLEDYMFYYNTGKNGVDKAIIQLTDFVYE